MTMLRSLAAAGALLSLSLLAACGSGGTEPAPSATASTVAAAPKIKIGVSVPAADHGWTAGVVWWAKEAMALNPDVE
ncbi:MAG: hypothetical protein ACO3YY_05740 [Phycisphaerales bacterium]